MRREAGRRPSATHCLRQSEGLRERIAGDLEHKNTHGTKSSQTHRWAFSGWLFPGWQAAKNGHAIRWDGDRE